MPHLRRTAFNDPRQLTGLRQPIQHDAFPI